jgi:hypothetical protein
VRGSAQEFLGLSVEDSALVELRLRLDVPVDSFKALFEKHGRLSGGPATPEGTR